MPAWLIPAAMTAGSMGLQALLGNHAANKQQRNNMALAKFQADANMQYLREQLRYDSPVEQMKRFKQAGLNPHLVYGQGSPGNQNAPMRYPDIKPADFQSSANQIASMLPLANQTALTRAQVNATNAKTDQTYAVTAVNKLQAQVLARNPALNDSAYKAIIDGLVSTAQIKASQAGITGNLAEWQPVLSQQAAVKVQREIELLDQRFNLGKLDGDIKTQVLKSKEFQNAILEVQKKFMADGDLTPQHIFQFITMLLTKSL